MVTKRFYNYKDVLWLPRGFMITKRFYNYKDVLWLPRGFMITKRFFIITKILNDYQEVL